MVRFVRRAFELWFAAQIFLSCGNCVAQTDLSGCISDSVGHQIPGARVTVLDAAGSPLREISTASDGTFMFQNIPGGTYTIVISDPGWETQLQHLSVGINQHSKININLTKRAPTEGTEIGAASGKAYYDEPEYKPESVSDSSEAAGYSSGAQGAAEHDVIEATVSMVDRVHVASDTESLEQIRARLRTDKNNAYLYHKLAQMEEEVKDIGGATQDYERAARLDPSEPSEFDWGRILLARGAYKLAVSVFDAGTAHHPDSLRLAVGLGICHYLQGEYHAASDQFIRASDLDPADPHPYFLMSKPYPGIGTGDVEKMLDRLHRFIEIQPNMGSAYFFYSSALWNNSPDRSSRLTEIRTSLFKATTLSPELSEPHEYLGMVLEELGETAKAIREFERALAISPDMEEAHYRLSRLLDRAGEKKRAAQEMRLFEQLRNEKHNRTEAQRLIEHAQ